MPRIALNGFGRMGKLALREMMDTGLPGEIVLLNDQVGTAEQHALLLEFDTVHGRWPREISFDESNLTAKGQKMRVARAARIEALPLAELGIDMVIDCTGAFKTEKALAPYFAAGVKKVVVSAPAKDMRRARSALNSMIPTTTGSATAITLIYPELKGRLNGHAVRVPLLNGSITDCVFEMERETTVDEVNKLFRAAAEGPLSGILGYETRPLVSADYTNDSRSGIIDALSTMVVNGTQVKVYAWYDNEWGYTCRLGDIARLVGVSM